MVKGQIQVGNNAFQPRPSPAIAIAGDPGSDTGATYANLSTTASAYLNPAQAAIGSVVTNQILPTGAPGTVALPPIAATTILSFDAPTQHNVPTAFANYRATAGLLNIGYAISEPFWATMKVAGASRFVMMQIFERRALTYTDANPDPFKVEMGNIGQHYYQWRYSSPVPPTNPTPTPTVTPPTTAISAPTFTSVTGTSVTVNFGTRAPVCGTVEYRVQGTAQWTSNINSITCTAGGTATSFAIPVSNLQVSTAYEMRPAVKDLAQNIAYGPVGVVMTTNQAAIQVTTPAITRITPTSVTLSFMTSAPTCSVVQYRVTGRTQWGADTDINALTCKAGDASQTHNKALTGISPGASLDVRAAAKDPAGNIYYSDPLTFVTPTA